MRISICISALLCGLAGCGGGGGGSGNPIVVGNDQPTVAFPGGTIVVGRSAGAFAPGSSVSVRLEMSGLSPVAVGAAIGGDWTTAVPIAAVDAGGGVWTATAVCPDPMPAAASVLLRLTMPDGDILESGVDEVAVERL